MNAFLSSPTDEKYYYVCGLEFGKDAGKKALVVRSLYGLRTAGASYRNHMADCMRTMGYRPCLADPNVWMKPMTQKPDQFEYYAYILLWVDDCLAIHHNAMDELLD